MMQASLSRYERRRTGQNEALGEVQHSLSEDSGPDSSKGEISLSPDEKAILDYVQQNEHVSKEELQHRSGIPTNSLDEILETLEELGLIDVSSGYTVVQIKSRSDVSRGNGGISQ